MPKNLFIPPLGTVITLADSWPFRLYSESRNQDLINRLSIEAPYISRLAPNFWSLSFERQVELVKKSKWKFDPLDEPHHRSVSQNSSYLPMCLEAGTELKIERIYIRQGQAGFDSVTFRCLKAVVEPGSLLHQDLVNRRGKHKAFRFWAKLNDANNIILED